MHVAWLALQHSKHAARGGGGAPHQRESTASNTALTGGAKFWRSETETLKPASDARASCLRNIAVNAVMRTRDLAELCNYNISNNGGHFELQSCRMWFLREISRVASLTNCGSKFALETETPPRQEMSHFYLRNRTRAHG